MRRQLASSGVPLVSDCSGNYRTQCKQSKEWWLLLKRLLTCVTSFPFVSPSSFFLRIRLRRNAVHSPPSCLEWTFSLLTMLRLQYFGDSLAPFTVTMQWPSKVSQVRLASRSLDREAFPKVSSYRCSRKEHSERLPRLIETQTTSFLRGWLATSGQNMLRTQNAVFSLFRFSSFCVASPHLPSLADQAARLCRASPGNANSGLVETREHVQATFIASTWIPFRCTVSSHRTACPRGPSNQTKVQRVLTSFLLNQTQKKIK